MISPPMQSGLMWPLLGWLLFSASPAGAIRRCATGGGELCCLQYRVLIGSCTGACEAKVNESLSKPSDHQRGRPVTMFSLRHSTTPAMLTSGKHVALGSHRESCHSPVRIFWTVSSRCSGPQNPLEGATGPKPETISCLEIRVCPMDGDCCLGCLPW
jgi:hypothetical protein